MDKFNLNGKLTKEMETVSCIYRIYNTETEKNYIGSTNNLRRRIKKHRDELSSGKHSNKHLQNAYNKYSRESFDVFIEEIVDVENLIERETYYIEKYNSFNEHYGYNLCAPGKFPKHTKESKKKLEDASKARILPVIAINKDTGEFFKEFESVSSAAEYFNTSSSNISRTCKGVINYMKNHIFVYKNEYDVEKNYIYVKDKKVISEETRSKMISSNSKSIPVYKYSLLGEFYQKFPSRSNCENIEGFNKEELRHILTKHKTIIYKDVVYSYYFPEEIFDKIENAYIKQEK